MTNDLCYIENGFLQRLFIGMTHIIRTEFENESFRFFLEVFYCLE